MYLSKINFYYLEYSYCKCDRKFMSSEIFVTKNAKLQSGSIFLPAKLISGE